MIQPSNSPVIYTHNLRKTYGEKVAVESLSLSIPKGEVFGFLGPNGAGKTTSIKMLLGLVKPDSGEASLLGRPVGDTQARAKIGFLPEHFRFHDWLTASEFLALHANLYHLPTLLARKRIPEVLDLVGLALYADQKIGQFSKGMLQRVGLAQALLNQPEIVFLDEPTSGLDPVGRIHVRDIIHNLREQGTTVFLNSHLLSEVEIICDRVAFVKRGRILRNISLQELNQNHPSLEIQAHPLTPNILRGLETWGSQAHFEGDKLTLTLHQENDIPAINRYLVEQGLDVFALHPHKESLEDLFLQIIGTDGGL